MISSLNQATRASRTPSQPMVSTKKHTTKPSQTVRPKLAPSTHSYINDLPAVDPNCPSAVLQFQHGTYVENADGSLILTPFAVDGRQLTSDPCTSSNSIYERYNQTETFQKYQVYKDAYHGVMRLDLYTFDGSPMNPMYIAFSPPLMLPTQTMNPTATATGATAASGAAKRDVDGEELEVPFNKNAKHIRRENQRDWLDATWVWWVGLGMTVFGG